jgi:S-methylmethionine-dependent homocysteine/selenocysteine methylase
MTGFQRRLILIIMHEVGAGATISGGCCGVGPKHMSQVAVEAYSVDDAALM